MAVADVFDALTSKRPYKEEFPIDKALDIIQEGRGKHFAPEIVDVFFEAQDELHFVTQVDNRIKRGVYRTICEIYSLFFRIII